MYMWLQAALPFPIGNLLLWDCTNQNFRKVRYLNMTFNTETLINAGKTFLMLFGELLGCLSGSALWLPCCRFIFHRSGLNAF